MTVGEQLFVQFHPLDEQRLQHLPELMSSLESALLATRATHHVIYLLIDEYDNFPNDILMTGRKREYYEGLFYGEGLLETVFKPVKAAAGGLGLDQVFITGVSPEVLSDMTISYG